MNKGLDVAKRRSLVGVSLFFHHHDIVGKRFDAAGEEPRNGSGWSIHNDAESGGQSEGPSAGR